MDTFRSTKVGPDTGWSGVGGVTLKDGECEYLEEIFGRFDGRFPSLEDMWGLMDEAWVKHGCTVRSLDKRVEAFYQHPVWLLNGLFIERDSTSMAHRSKFAEWIGAQGPRRLADIGGGFGTLARMVGRACPSCDVEVIEPHPFDAAIDLAQEVPNAQFKENLTGEYDILVATDVFEHVSDPLGLVAATGKHLSPGGQYLIANCFWPVIECHLPCTFHSRYSWNAALCAMGFQRRGKVSYGTVFVRGEDLDLNRARRVERVSRWLFPLLDRLPKKQRKRIIRRIWSVG